MAFVTWTVRGLGIGILGRQVQVRPSAVRVRCCSSNPASSTPVADPQDDEQQEWVAPKLPEGFTPPQPQRFVIRRENWPEVLLGSVTGIMRGYTGAVVSGYRVRLGSSGIEERSTTLPQTRAAKPLQLFEFESCPFCRKVREAVNMLDLDVYVYPCRVRFRPQIASRGGKEQFPYLIDPNTGFEGYESDSIVRYLFETYGDGKVPLPLAIAPVTNLTSTLATLTRSGKGGYRATRTVFPSQPLEFWGYEPSPFVRVVREKLSELELPYLLHPTSRGSVNRKKQMERTGGPFQVPYLEDINLGVKLFESPDIVEYLEEVYGPNAEGASAALPDVLKDQLPTLETAIMEPAVPSGEAEASSSQMQQ